MRSWRDEIDFGRSREVAALAGSGHERLRRATPASGTAADAQAAVTGIRTRAFTIDRNWRIKGVSSQAADWIGVGEKDLEGRDARGSLPLGEAFGAIEAAFATGQSSLLRLRSLFRPGRWEELRVEPTDAGAVISFRDVTAEATDGPGAAAPLEHGALGDPVEMALLDSRGVIVSVNAAWRAAFAAPPSPEGFVGVASPYEEVCQRIVPNLDAVAFHEAMGRLLAREVQALTHIYVVATAAGPRWRQVSIAPLRAGAAQFIAIHEDLTQVARAQAALRQAADELHSAQQDERERMAIELHDSTGQHLAALGIGVLRLRELMGSHAKARGILDDMAASLKEAVEEIRVMSHLMEPPSLHRHGLEGATRRYVKGFGVRTGLSTVFRSEGQMDRVSPLIQHTAFRVVQEALSNVHRHAHANGVEVELASRDGELKLRIADDGAGITSLRQAHLEGIPPGVGISGMRSRVEELGGWLDIGSDGAGTVVTASVPLPETSLRKPAAPQRRLADQPRASV